MSNNEYQGIRHDREIMQKLLQIFPTESQLVSITHKNLLTTSVVHTKDLTSFHICILTPECNLNSSLQNDLLKLGTWLTGKNHTFILSYCCDVPAQTDFVHRIELQSSHFKCSPYLSIPKVNDEMIVAGIQKKIWLEQPVPIFRTHRSISISIPVPGYTIMKFITNDHSEVIGAEIPNISIHVDSLHISSSFFTQQIRATLKSNGYSIKITNFNQVEKSNRISLIIYQSYEEIKMIIDSLIESQYKNSQPPI